MVLTGETMDYLLLIAILMASFALVIGRVQVISRMLERDTDPGEPGDEPPGTDPPVFGSPRNGVVGPLGWRQ